MRVNPMLTVIVRCSGILLVAEVLIFQIACSPIQTTPTMTSQGDGAATSFTEGTASPTITEVAQSPLQTPLPVTARPDRGATGFQEETRPLITTTVETAIAPQEDEMPSRDNPKLDSSLNQLLAAYHQGGLAEAQVFVEKRRMVLKDDRVQVEVIAPEEAAIPSLKETIEAVGGEYQGHYQTLLQALVPIDALEALAQRPEVQVIRQPQRPVTQ